VTGLRQIRLAGGDETRRKTGQENTRTGANDFGRRTGWAALRAKGVT
jgi:hypothetical protein